MQVVSGVKMFYNRCIAMNMSTRTLDTYRYHIERFIRSTRVSDLSNVTEDTIHAFFAQMRKEGYAPDTIRGEYVALNTMFNYLYDNGYLGRNPMQHVRRPKLPKVFARTFTSEEVSQILQFYANKSDFISVRNYTILAVLFGTGIRRNELLNLSVMDIRFDESVMTVTGKGNKQRMIPITGSLKRSLKRYMTVRGTTPCKYLFITRDEGKMSETCIRDIFNQVKEKLKLHGKRFSPHTMRHTFAKMFLLNGGDLFALQKILGHEDISTTRMYVDYTENEMSNQMQQCSPLENHRWTYF